MKEFDNCTEVPFKAKRSTSEVILGSLTHHASQDED